MTRSPWRRCAALAVLCLIPLTACESRPGAAAFVGDTRIGDQRIQDLVAEGLSEPAVRAGVKDVSNYRGVVLSRLIKHELIARLAARAGVTATDGEVSQVLTAERNRLGGAEQLQAAAAAAPLGIPRSQIEPFYRDVILLDKIGAELTKSDFITDADLMDYYSANARPEDPPFEQIKAQVLQRVRGLRAARATEKSLKEYLRGVRVKVSPRYGRFDASKFFDAQLAPVLKPAPDDFFRRQSPGGTPQPPGSPAPEAPTP